MPTTEERTALIIVPDVYLGGTATMNVFTGTEIIRSLGGSGAINAVTQVANTTDVRIKQGKSYP